MIIKGSCRDFRIIEKSLRDPLMFSSMRHAIKAYMEYSLLWWEIP
jgi:hypothetical protein